MKPDPQLALESYRDHADGYDASCRRTQPLRIEAVEALRLRPGDTVLDVASGTGMSFALIQERIGPTGHLIAVELCPEMMGHARNKVQAADWKNVTLIESTIEEASLNHHLDAILCFYTHDVMRSKIGLHKIFEHAKPQARIAVAGLKLFPWWLAPLNIYARAKARPYATTLEGLNQPWSLLVEHVPALNLRSTQFGMGYLASGRYPGR